MKARIDQIAYALPQQIVTNLDLQKLFPEWDFPRLEKRTGVYQRHIASINETALELAVSACEQLQKENNVEFADVDGIIFCTETPDYPIPSNACLLHGQLGFPNNVLALDVNMGCSGYIYCLEVARSLIVSGAATKILLATGDTYSRLINAEDRATRILFGDGAAVSLINASPEDATGVIDVKLGSEGKHYDRFVVPAGGARLPISQDTMKKSVDKSGNVRTPRNIVMDGFGVLSFFNATIPGEVRSVLSRNHLTIDDIDIFVFHQASSVALDSIMRALEIPDDKMVNNMRNVGNLVSASIPVALKMSMELDQVKPGALAVLCGFGVGLSWGTALIRI